MNAKFEIEVLSQDSNEVVEAFKVEGGAQQLFNRIADQARSVVPDLSTKKSRDQIASLAMKVAKTKTAFDAHGKALKEQYTVITGKIDADRKLFRDQCDALRDEIRQPLTDWEDAKKAREAEIQMKIADFDKGRIDENSHSELIKSVIAEIDLIQIDESFEDFQDVAKLRKYECLEHMRAVLIEREKYEAEQAELERLRLAEQARQQQERDAQIARDATEKANREAEEKARFEAEKNQREKAESEQREARLLAQKEAAILREQQLKIQAEQQAKQAEIDKQQAVEAERVRIEIQRLDQVEVERKSEEARKADVEHRRQINREAFDAIQALCLGIPEAQIKELIGAIAKNQIPHVSIKY